MLWRGARLYLMTMFPHPNLPARLFIMDLLQKPLTIDVRTALDVVTRLRGAHGLADRHPLSLSWQDSPLSSFR